ncbi:MAG: ankyrin repeat domain-containing protein [Nocardioidaceae bacterium]
MDLTADELALLQQAFDWARSGDVLSLSAYLDGGRPVDLTNDRGDTLLILAAYHVQGPAVELLLGRGADVDRINDNGQTALGAAVFRRSTDIVTRLLAAGAGVDIGPRSARHVARFFGLDEMRQLLGDLPATDEPAPAG